MPETPRVEESLLTGVGLTDKSVHGIKARSEAKKQRPNVAVQMRKLSLRNPTARGNRRYAKTDNCRLQKVADGPTRLKRRRTAGPETGAWDHACEP